MQIRVFCDAFLMDKNKTLFAFLSNWLLVAALLFASIAAYSHDNVVVIPILADEVQNFRQTGRVAKADTTREDYVPFGTQSVDKTTGLSWQPKDDNLEYTWLQAWAYCDRLEFGNRIDWRLPSVTELQSIVDYGRSSVPVIDFIAFPTTKSSRYWSATNGATKSTYAWYVSFSDGTVRTTDKNEKNFVRCVRDGRGFLLPFDFLN